MSVRVPVACFTVLGGTARAHRTPAPSGQDFLVPTLFRVCARVNGEGMYEGGCKYRHWVWGG